MFDELKEVKYFKEITDFMRFVMQNIKYFKEIKRLRSLQTFNGLLFSQNSSIIDIQLGYI